MYEGRHGSFIAQPDRFVGSPSAPINQAADYSNASGFIVTGPEFFTIFSGQTGAELATTNYLVPRNNDRRSDPPAPQPYPIILFANGRCHRLSGTRHRLPAPHPTFFHPGDNTILVQEKFERHLAMLRYEELRASRPENCRLFVQVLPGELAIG